MHAPFIFTRHHPVTPSQAPGGFLFFMGLVLGLAAWLSLDLMAGGHPLLPGIFATDALFLLWVTLSASMPVSLMLLVQRPGQPGLWLQAMILAALVSGLSLWAGWNSHAPYIDKVQIRLALALSVTILLLLILPFFQSFLRHRALRIRYTDLFEFAWHNALCLLLSATFLLICWGLMLLWAKLFDMIGIAFFSDLFTNRFFVPVFSGLIVAAGMLIGRNLDGPVHSLRQVIFSLFFGLLPLLSLGCVIFSAAALSAILSTGLESLWQAGISGHALLALVAVMTLMINAVYQDGSQSPNYHRVVRYLVHAGILTLPLLAGLALHALQLRLAQHGFSQLRLAGLLLGGLLGLHAIGYALAVLLPGRDRLAAMKPVNIIAAWIAIVMLVLVNSTVLDLHRLTVDQQFERLLKGSVSPQDFDLKHIRHDSGRYGLMALQALEKQLQAHQPASSPSGSSGETSAPTDEVANHTDVSPAPAQAQAQADPADTTARADAPPAAPADRGVRRWIGTFLTYRADTVPPALTDAGNRPGLDALAQSDGFRARLRRILDSTSRREADRDEEDAAWLDDPKALAAHIRLAPGVGKVEASWWESLASGEIGPRECHSQAHQCVLMERDLDRDGTAERMLCVITPSYWGIECQLYTLEKPRAAHKPAVKEAGGTQKDPNRGGDSAPATDRQWQSAGKFHFNGTTANIDEIRQSLAEGEFKLTKPRWPLIESHGAQAIILTD
ncbi:MAG: DUF4153 domain-containing protein [Lautropia sp.]|nr:DUF4153 domain-containing protein [Lautropia sp.]